MSMIYLVGNGYVSDYISQIKIENRKKRKEDKGEVKIRKNSKDIKN